MSAGIALKSDVPVAAPSAPRPRWLKWTLRGAVLALSLSIFGTPWWGPPVLSRLDFFRVQRVEFEGVRYANAADLVTQLALDSTASIWDDLDRYATRVTNHSMVQTVDVTRRLPGTLVVTIVERYPVALVANAGVLVPIDRSGNRLPIDPLRKPVDAPVLAAVDTVILQFLDGLRTASPRMYARVIEIRRVGREELTIELKGIRVRARHDVTVERLEDILRVEESLAQQNQRAVELDLRFQDQVIARMP